MANEKPIIFSSEMVGAILDGRKTQTRRVVKPQPIGKPNHIKQYGTDGKWRARFGWQIAGGEGREWRCPYGKVGDRLWVKEKHSLGGNGVFFPDSCDGTVRVAWTSGRFMKKEFARIWLEITGIRVERIQQMCHTDWVADFCPKPYETEKALQTFVGDKNMQGMAQTFWDSLNSKRGYGWDKNPWVWVIEFKRVQEMPNGK